MYIKTQNAKCGFGTGEHQDVADNNEQSIFDNYNNVNNQLEKSVVVFFSIIDVPTI